MSLATCEIPGCGATITFRVNRATGKTNPLVPYDEKYAKALRFAMDSPENDPDGEFCVRDDEGAWMSHYANCTDPGAFAKRKR